MRRPPLQQPPREGRSTRGYFEHFDAGGGTLTIGGWLLGRSADDTVRLLVDGNDVTGPRAALDRPDVDRSLPEACAARGLGFSFDLPLDEAKLGDVEEIAVVATSTDGSRRQISSWFDPELLRAPPPLPPTHLMRRVAHTDSGAMFVSGGMQTFADFWRTVARHRDPAGISTMLDWGCGCGRVTWLFAAATDVDRVCGCDVDGEAVAWAAANVPDVAFATSPFAPPTAYADGAFDLVTSYSVFTHLTADAQRAWLDELRRILRPGGLAVVSVHGAYAASLSLDRTTRERFEASGFHDHGDRTLDAVTDDRDYYRATFQNEAWTREHWGDRMRILEHVPQGVMGYQDLVVLANEPPA